MQAEIVRCVATASLKTTYLAHFGHDSVEGSDFNMTRIFIIAATMLFATLSSAFAHHPLGAEATPLLAYLAGFGVTQLLIAVGVGILAREIWKVRSVNALQPRLAGALVAGVGLAYLIENVEGMIFPGM